ncbi:MAG TPA: aminotransferase class I/II-fold pyridoxal phosphate-dependent enzyme [Candidatus Cybelea sp.]|nr:aminotransferase class I/II-fold pyridoxal phosphate-dependent enzyme [Candidatus Cybelea sp.]
MTELDRLIVPATRAIVVNSPNNPTGYQFTPQEFEAIVALARRHGLWLFSDEVYRGSEREAERLSAACDLYERGVSLGGTAKAYGLAGLRIGWVSAKDAALMKRMATIKDYLTICSAAPSEFLAAVALRHSDVIEERLRHIARRNLDLLDEFFARRHDLFGWARPRAGTTAFPRYLGGGSETFCERAAHEGCVLLLPSAAFDAGDSHLRVGYGRANLPDALAALERFLTTV